MTISVFPLDDRMPWLRELLDAGRMSDRLRGLLKNVFPECASLEVTMVEVAGYRFGKRCTIRYGLDISGAGGEQIESMTIFGKTHHDGRGRVVLDHLEQLWNRHSESDETCPPLISKPLGYLPDLRMYFQEATRGRDLYSVEERRERVEIIDQAGRLLASLHASGIRVEASHGLEDELALIQKWSEYLEVVRPDLEPMIRSTLGSIRRVGNTPGDAEAVFAHRDFYDKQVIASGEGARLIDFDTAAMADPAIDVGNFLAHLVLRGFQRGWERDAVDEESDRFISSYIPGNPRVRGERIRFYTATSLFRLACLYGFRSAWRDLSEPLLEACRRHVRSLSEVHPVGTPSSEGDERMK